MVQQQRSAKEPARPLLPRIREDVCRPPLFDDAALVHEDEVVADIACELHLVRDDDHRHPALGEVAHHDQHLADELRVERRRDLVEEHHVRLHHQRPRDRDALLLAPRELVRVAVRLLLEPYPGHQLPPALLGLAPRLPLHAPGREGDVVERLQVREEVELLEDDPDLLPDRARVHALPRDLLPLEEDPARLDRLEQVDAAKQRALAAPARPDDDEHLTRIEGEVDAVEDDVVAEALVHLVQPDHRLRRDLRRRSVPLHPHVHRL